MQRIGRASVVLLGVLIVTILPLALNACNPQAPSSATGTLTMLVTDKPFPFDLIDRAEVTITRVEVRLQDAEDQDADDAADDGTEDPDGEEGMDEANANEDAAQEDVDGDMNENENEGQDPDGNVNASDDDADGRPFLVVFEGEETFNLLELQNGTTATLVNASLPVGTYSQVRIIVSSGFVVLKDDEREFDLKVPSGAQTGIKLHATFDVDEDAATTLLMDVDLSKAFVPIPGGHIDEPSDIRLFHFKPSHAMRITNMETAGSIAGTVLDAFDNPLENVSVTAFRSEETEITDEDVTSTATAAEGTYVLSGLEPGIYRLEFSLEGYSQGGLSDVEVTAATQTTVESVFLAESEL